MNDIVNALLIINANQVDQFLDNWRFDETDPANPVRLANDFAPYQTNPGTPAIDVYDTRQCEVYETMQGLYKVNSQGAQPLQMVPIYFRDYVEPDWTDPQDPDPKDVLTIVHYIREAFPGAVVIADVFTQDGVRHGQTLVPAVLDDDGNVIVPEQVTGTPTYPPLPKLDMLLYMPDDVVHDTDPESPGFGNEISRTPATDYKQVELLAGWRDRRYE